MSEGCRSGSSSVSSSSLKPIILDRFLGSGLDSGCWCEDAEAAAPPEARLGAAEDLREDLEEPDAEEAEEGDAARFLEALPSTLFWNGRRAL
mmetsp:Transcript_92704/g.262157  ORF Transcript_92704/g.262157 Transcript_92704/m.262157 type:complete len:92 (-) Transcript_92704:89-364(-)